MGLKTTGISTKTAFSVTLSDTPFAADNVPRVSVAIKDEPFVEDLIVGPKPEILDGDFRMDCGTLGVQTETVCRS